MALGTMLQEKHLGIPTWGWLGIGAGGMVFILLGRGGKKAAPVAQTPGVVLVGHDVGPPATPPLGPPGPPGPPGGTSNQLQCDTWPFFLRATCQAAEQLGFIHLGKSAVLARAPDAQYARDYAQYESAVNALPGLQRRDFFFNLEHPGAAQPAWYLADMQQYGAVQ